MVLQYKIVGKLDTNTGNKNMIEFGHEICASRDETCCNKHS